MLSGKCCLSQMFAWRHKIWMSLSLLLIWLLAFVSGCASTQADPFNKETTRASFNKKERELWESAEKLERCITANLEPIEGQEEVEAYLHEVMERVAFDFDNSEIGVRIHLLPDPSPNAFVLPNGAMYVNTGLLALLENEAQLATVLGHEFCHFRYRHTYREAIKEQNERIKAAIFGGTLAAMLAGSDASQSLTELWTISSVRGYSRALESEADHASLIGLVEAKYQPEQAIKAFERLQSVSDPEDEDNLEFATHPKLSDRIDSYRKTLKKREMQQYTFGNEVGAQRYDETLYNVFTFNAQLNLDDSNYQMCRDNVTRCLELDPNCAKAHFLQGELMRCSPSTDRDVWTKALACYKRAITVDPNYADAYREVGLLHRYLGDADQAKAYLTKYLSLTFDAPDIDIIKYYLMHLDDVAKDTVPPYRAPEISAEDFRDKIKTIGLMRVGVPDDISEMEKRQEEFEAAVTDKLKDLGFRVIPSKAYTDIYESFKGAMGDFFDPTTGEPLEGKHEVLLDHVNREYLASHHVDALAYAAVIVVKAQWDMNIARWHGIRESSTGKDGFWGAMSAPSAYGTLPALSFGLVITSLYDEPCYIGYGGIQLCSRVHGNSFINVPVYELLADPEKNAQGVDIACHGLFDPED